MAVWFFCFDLHGNRESGQGEGSIADERFGRERFIPQIFLVWAGDLPFKPVKHHVLARHLRKHFGENGRDVRIIPAADLQFRHFNRTFSVGLGHVFSCRDIQNIFKPADDPGNDLARGHQSDCFRMLLRLSGDARTAEGGRLIMSARFSLPDAPTFFSSATSQQQ